MVYLHASLVDLEQEAKVPKMKPARVRAIKWWFFIGNFYYLKQGLKASEMAVEGHKHYKKQAFSFLLLTGTSCQPQF
jgi:hypothetical protein